MTLRKMGPALVLLATTALALGGCAIAEADEPRPDPPCSSPTENNPNNSGGAVHAASVRFLACTPPPGYQ